MYLVWKFCTLTFLYGAVLRWHQRSNPSFANDSVDNNVISLIILKIRINLLVFIQRVRRRKWPCFTFYSYILDCKPQNYRPNHSKGHFKIAIHDFCEMKQVIRIYEPCLSEQHPQDIPSAPIDTSFTPLLATKSRALLTLAILWNRSRPLSGLGSRSPDITSNNSISLSPSRKSSSMVSICKFSLLKWELHHAVKV